MAVNSLLYLNQSIPPYGVSLNSITERSTAFPLSKSIALAFEDTNETCQLRALLQMYTLHGLDYILFKIRCP